MQLLVQKKQQKKQQKRLQKRFQNPRAAEVVDY